jgi:hypothetical protein
MRFTNEAAANAFRVLDKCCAELEPAGPWRWRCLVQNGVRLPLSASLEEGFLQLAGRPVTMRKCPRALEQALLENGTLAGGVKFALDAQSRVLHLRTDIVLVDETQLLDRMQWALDGFHHGYRWLKSSDFYAGDGASAAPVSMPDVVAASTPALLDGPALPEETGASLGERLRETSWACTERSPGDFSAELAADSAPPARIRMSERGLVFSVELARFAAAEASRRALAVFLLTASGALRMVRAHAAEADEQWSFGLQVFLPPAPAAEEIDHALAALSIAYRTCAREANVLLDEAAARCYLTARDVPTTYDQEPEKEN